MNSFLQCTIKNRQNASNRHILEAHLQAVGTLLAHFVKKAEQAGDISAKY
jgi:hypothetical protein